MKISSDTQCLSDMFKKSSNDSCDMNINHKFKGEWVVWGSGTYVVFPK